jgi:hypothetical protein
MIFKAGSHSKDVSKTRILIEHGVVYAGNVGGEAKLLKCARYSTGLSGPSFGGEI